MHPGSLIIVRCPMGFANRQLQNTIGCLESVGGNPPIAYVRLLTGRQKGRLWQFNPQHIRLANNRMERDVPSCVSLALLLTIIAWAGGTPLKRTAR